MENRNLVKEYESESGKKAVVDGQETIGFKRWKQQEKSDPKLEDVISTFRKGFRKDINDIIKIYLKKTNISPSPANTLKSLKHYFSSIFPSRVIYKNKSFEIDSDGKLDLRSLFIKDLQNVKGLFKLRFFEHLDLSDNALDFLPTEIGNFTNLKCLNLSHNRISKIPKEIGNLTNLKKLFLNSNNLKEVPKEIGNLTDLESFNISFNDISTIPKEIGNLKNLEALKILNNSINKIPIKIKNLTNLKDLWMGSNNISKIPKEIGNLTNLEGFSLKNNNITMIPKEIGDLKNLRYLNLDENDISNIPKEVGNLINLKVFNIRNNNITKDTIPSVLLNNRNIRLRTKKGIIL